MNIQQPELFVNTYSQENLLKLFYDRLPAKPYCSNQKRCERILPKRYAKNYVYIEPNALNCTSWFIFDIDRPTELIDWIEGDLPVPNIVIYNTESRNCHIYYGLNEPIWTAAPNRQKMTRYAADVQRGLLRLVRGDGAYRGLLARNPLHPAACMHTPRLTTYTLDELNEYLNKELKKKFDESDIQFGLGRNCEVWEYTAKCAYKNARHFLLPRDGDRFVDWCINKAMEYNQKLYLFPLGYNEIRSIGKSVGRWCIRRMSRQKFMEWGDKRRVKSIVVRKQKADDRAAVVREFFENHPGASVREAARVLQIPYQTIDRLKKR